MLTILTGPSGVGKTTAIKGFARTYPIPQVRLLTSTTTRSPREGELSVGGTDEYEHIDELVFDLLEQKHEFLQVFSFKGARYAHLLSRLQDEAVWGRDYIYFAVLLIEGAQTFQKYALEHNLQNSIRFIYLDLLTEEMRRFRLKERGEKDPSRFTPEIEKWRSDAEHSGVPFTFINTERMLPEEVTAQVRRILFSVEENT